MEGIDATGAVNIISIRVAGDFWPPQAGVTATIGWFGILVILLGLALIVWRSNIPFGVRWRAVEIKLPVGGGGAVTIRPNHHVIQIAHQAWVELVTRKVGLPFDVNHDVIVEVYDSWYAAFREFRALARQVPADTIRGSKDSQELVNLLVSSLNDGLRPHLTCWQAKFRRWYMAESQKPENRDKSPQEIQKAFPEYSNLIADLIEVNGRMVVFAEGLRRLAQDKEAL